MLCPFCSHQIAPRRQRLYTITDAEGDREAGGRIDLRSRANPRTKPEEIHLMLEWAKCPNEECCQIVVRVNRLVNNTIKESWFAVPRRKPVQQVDALVPAPRARDFKEACAVLEDSSRMASVLARRILADLLKEYAGLTDYSLAARIDKFIADPKHPSRLRENLHYLREIGDFSAHTMEDDQGQILEVTREQAEWTIKVVTDLFDYFIVGPEKDKALRQAFDDKLKQAGRKPIKKPTA